jgi:FKBP-type peptidyl-prolyl cis-trans isomerase FklB
MPELNMKSLLFALLLLVGSVSAHAQMKNLKDSASYSVGLLIAQNLKSQGITDLNPEMIAKALADYLGSKPLAIELPAAQQLFNQYSTAIREEQGKAVKVEGENFLAQNKTRPGVITTASGLQYEVIRPGDGMARPTPTSQVTVHYTGTLIDGTKFDSSVDRGQPATFGVNGVIAGWTEALQLMTKGTKLRLYIPYNLAYGERGSPPNIKPYACLLFDVELIDIK